MINQLLDKTIQQYGIVAKQLASQAGISENHLSEFRRGKGDITTGILGRLIEAMDELAPGSKRYFCLMLAGAGEKQQMEEPLEQLAEIVSCLDESELPDALNVISNQWRRSHKSTVRSNRSKSPLQV